MKPLPLIPRSNPPEARDASPEVKNLASCPRMRTEDLARYQDKPADGSPNQAENIRTPSISPPQSDFTFKIDTPTLIATSPTPAEGYRVGKTKRRRRRSKATKLPANGNLLPPDPSSTVGRTTSTSEQQADSLTTLPAAISNDPKSTEHIADKEEPCNRPIPMPTVDELTGKTWVTSAISLTPIDESSPADVVVDLQANTQPEAKVEAATPSQLRQSYAAVASGSHTSIQTTLYTIPPSKQTKSTPRPLQTDPDRDWPSSLPPLTGPTEPATKSRRSRFFPRQQSPLSSPNFRARRPSSTFRHPRFRERAKAVGVINPTAAQETGLLTPPATQDPSSEPLLPQAESGDPPNDLQTPSVANVSTTKIPSSSPPRPQAPSLHTLEVVARGVPHPPPQPY